MITEHSTIGVVVTCDGSFGKLHAKQYEPAEEETIKQLKALKKPFVVLLNTIHPYSESTKQLAAKKKKNMNKSATNEFRTDEKKRISTNL